LPIVKPPEGLIPEKTRGVNVDCDVVCVMGQVHSGHLK